MAEGELILFWGGLGIYVIAGGMFLYGLLKKSERPLVLGARALLAGAAIQTIALGLRWYHSGHMPGDNLYELNSVGSWMSVIIFLVLQHRYGKIRGLGVVVAAVSVLMMLHGISKPHEAGPLSDEYQSAWFYVHITSSFAAYGCYVVATASSIFILIRRGPEFLRDRLPSPEFLEDLSYRLIAYGFGAHAVMVASGSIWANKAWGTYWSWDPVETWSLVTWLIYAFYLHARPFLGWRGKRLAWVTVVALAAIVFTFWGVSHLPSMEYSHV